VVLIGVAVRRGNGCSFCRPQQPQNCGSDDLGSRHSLAGGHLVEGGDSLVVETDVDLGCYTIMLADV